MAFAAPLRHFRSVEAFSSLYSLNVGALVFQSTPYATSREVISFVEYDFKTYHYSEVVRTINAFESSFWG